MNPKTIALAVLSLSVFGAVASAQSLPPVITVVPASAPNLYGSPSYAAWEANAINALQNNLPIVGGSRLVTPTAYEAAGPVIAGGDNVVTGFSSWRGVADPAAPFAGEFGNRVQFGLKILSPVTKFALENVSSSATSTGGILDYSFADFSGLTYGQLGAVGISYGADGIKGTGDDVTYTGAGDSTSLLVNEAYYAGDGNALTPDASDPVGTHGDRQLAINGQVGVYGGSRPFLFTGTYGLNGVTGSGSVVITPEPATLAALAGAGVLGLRRRRA